MMWLAPKAADEIRKRVTGAALSLRDRATARRDEAAAGVEAVVTDLTQRGQAVGDSVAGAVARGAHVVSLEAQRVEQMAAAAGNRH